MVILNASDPKTAKQMNDIIKNAKHVFILVYMVGCGPCNATRPEWKKMCESLGDQYSSNNDVAILDLDSKFMNEVKGIGEVSGFPTMKYISDNGNILEAYEDSNIPNKERSSNSFIEWIESKVEKNKNNYMSKNPRTINSKNLTSAKELSELLSSKQLNSAKTLISKKKKINKTGKTGKMGKKTSKTKSNIKSSTKKRTKKAKGKKVKRKMQ